MQWSNFDMSHARLGDYDMGKLYPVTTIECVPGDYFEASVGIVLRFMPMVAPVLHRFDAFIHFFFVPYRILWPEWEEFITGGPDGTSAPSLPAYPKHEPPMIEESFGKHSLWCHLGFPPLTELPQDDLPASAFPLYAYNKIYNEYYRDQNIIDEVPEDSHNIKRRCWPKDYFTTALPWRQRGTNATVPILTDIDTELLKSFSDYDAATTTGAVTHSDLFSSSLGYFTNIGGQSHPYSSNSESLRQAKSGAISRILKDYIENSTSILIHDLRASMAMQRFLEANARGGARYTEFLKEHFNVSPTDSRLDRPEYIGGYKSSISVSEVVQTSSTTNTPQANLAGHGLLADKGNIGSYRVQEFGMIIGILSIMPEAMYFQGIPYNWMRETRYDFYFPEFAHLSERQVKEAELRYFGQNEPPNSETTGANSYNKDTAFGYVPIYSELRSQQSRVVGNLTDTLAHWHAARVFPQDYGGHANRTLLNRDFLECNPPDDFFAVQDGTPNIICHMGFDVLMRRPLPYEPEPGLRV